MYPQNATKRKLRNGEPVFGMSLTEMSSPAIPRVLAELGYDFVFLDMEHSAEGFDSICNVVWASRCAGLTPLVRVPDTERFYISRVLDAGAQGVIVPRVETVQQVDAIVSYCRYPPHGTRGVALGGRHTDFRPLGDPRAAMEQANNEVLVSIQIETLPGLKRVHELAARAGVDVLFVGPQDLSVALDLPNEWNSAVLTDAIRTVVAAARATGTMVGIQGRTVELSTRWMAEGARLLVLGTTLMLLAEGARNRITELRKATLGDEEVSRVSAQS